MTVHYRIVPMRRSHFGLIILLLVCLVAAIGFYQNWFKISEHRDLTNKVDVNLKIDPDKMKDDVQRATHVTERKASELSDKVKEEAKDLKTRAANRN